MIEIQRGNRKEREGRGIWKREVGRMVVWRDIEIRIISALECKGWMFVRETREIRGQDRG